jgi:hypothetical protein
MEKEIPTRLIRIAINLTDISKDYTNPFSQQKLPMRIEPDVAEACVTLFKSGKHAQFHTGPVLHLLHRTVFLSNQSYNRYQVRTDTL